MLSKQFHCISTHGYNPYSHLITLPYTLCSFTPPSMSLRLSHLSFSFISHGVHSLARNSRRKGLFWLIAEGYCPSWQGNQITRNLKQLVPLCPKSVRRKQQCCTCSADVLIGKFRTPARNYITYSGWAFLYQLNNQDNSP